MYCAVLWEQARECPDKFAHWLIDTANLQIDDRSGDWELGYEVVFYRDFLWHKEGRSARAENLPAKRTFDLCLFGERDLVIIEAKLCSRFESKQNSEIADDRQKVSDLIVPASKRPKIHLVGLACSDYWTNLNKHGSSETKNLFKNRIDWGQVSSEYDHPILRKADGMYQKEREHTKT
jgi:hypothetical protein